MFRYPYGANGDPDLDLDLLSAVYHSNGQQSIGQPMEISPRTDHYPPFFVDGDFPTSSSLPSLNDYFAHRADISEPATLMPFFSSSSSAGDFLDCHRAEPVRRVYSTGDLAGPAEKFTQEGPAVPGRVGRYSAEERKERIERYRSKRNHRNFHKKITYACRKTLADSRPRVRGRFARNGETDVETEVEAESSEASYGCYGHGARNSGGSYNNFDGLADGGEFWLKHMQAALATTDEEAQCSYDEDIWASLDSVFSVNLLS